MISRLTSATVMPTIDKIAPKRFKNDVMREFVAAVAAVMPTPTRWMRRCSVPAVGTAPTISSASSPACRMHAGRHAVPAPLLAGRAPQLAFADLEPLELVVPWALLVPWPLCPLPFAAE